MPSTSPKQAGGFTLLELLVVVAILAILAGILLPRFDSSTEDAREAAFQTNIDIMNKAIDLYRVQHLGEYPGEIAGEVTWDNFVTHMTTQTDRNGEPGSAFGPYLRTGIPVNPYTGTNTGSIYTGAIPLASTTAWFYDRDQGLMIGNRSNNTEAQEGTGGANPLPGHL